jgi:hypothetical protein
LDVLFLFLFVCQCNSEVKVTLWGKVEESSPGEMDLQLKSLSFEDMTQLVLNTFYARYIHEWNDTYDALFNDICYMYTSYTKTKIETMSV